MEPPGVVRERIAHVELYSSLRTTAVALCLLVTCQVVSRVSLADALPTWTQLASNGPYNDLSQGRYGHVAILDPARRMMVVYGGAFGTREKRFSLDLTSGQWTSTPVTGSPFSTITGALGVHVPAADALMLFGGSDGTVTNATVMIPLNAVPQYRNVVTQGTPPVARIAPSGCYDPVRHRLIVFGGYNPVSGFMNDLWELELSTSPPTWTLLEVVGAAPSQRDGASMIYDPVTDSAILYGGNLNGTANGEVWRLSLVDDPGWTQLAPVTPSGVSPPSRFFHAAVYDSATRSMLTFGGYGTTSMADVWRLELDQGTSWTPVSPGGTTPSLRHSLAAIFDPVRRRLVAYGGRDEAANRNLSDTPVLDVQTDPPHWVGNVGAPVPRYAASAIYDPEADRFVLYGGARDVFGAVADPPGTIWQLAMGEEQEWEATYFSGNRPQSRFGHQCIHDPLRSRMLLIGGYAGAYLMDVWALSLGSSPTWTLLQAAGPTPTGRNNFVAAYDSKRDRVIVMGGNNAGHYMNDVWALSLSNGLSWQQLTPAGTLPRNRMGHAGFYDPEHDRLLVFSGLGELSPNTPLNDAWELRLGDSLEWRVTNSTFQRAYHSVANDPHRRRTLFFGGLASSAYGDVFESPWQLQADLSPVSWSGAASPPARYGHAASYDTRRDRMVIFGGTQYGGLPLGDMWFLTWPEQPTSVVASVAEWAALPRHVRLSWHSDTRAGDLEVVRRSGTGPYLFIGKPVQDGASRLFYDDDTVEPGHEHSYALRTHHGSVVGEVTIMVPLDLGVRLEGFTPNPSARTPAIAFTLADDRPALLEVYDLAGRMVWRQDVGAFGPGAHRAVMPTSCRLSTGMYVMRLLVGDEMRTARGAIVR